MVVSLAVLVIAVEVVGEGVGLGGFPDTLTEGHQTKLDTVVDGLYMPV